jgi:hypothetical protein
VQTAFEEIFSTCLILGDKDHPDAKRLNLWDSDIRGLNQKFAWNGRENPHTVATLPVRGCGATMCQPPKGGQGFLKNVMVGRGVDGGYKPDSTGVMVKPLINKGCHR